MATHPTMGIMLLLLALLLGPFTEASASAMSAAVDPAAAVRQGVEDRLELPDDPYVPVPPGQRIFSPAHRSWREGFFLTQVNVDASGMNIVGDAANEPSIAVDPIDPNRMVIGWRQFDTISSNFRQAGYGYTADGGQSWTFPGPIEPGVFRSDPVLDANNEGTIFYYSLTTSPSYACQVFRSDDGGVTWSDAVPAYGGDKGWMTIDRTGGLGEGNIYCASRDGVSTTIIMTRSIDDGLSFQSPVTVPERPGRGTIAVGVDGELYATGSSFSSGQFVVARSTNAYDPSATPVFEYSTTVDLGGSFTAYAGPNPSGLLGQAEVFCSHAPGTTYGNVYVLSSVDPPGADPLDVYFIRSTDRGVTWSAPVRINDDPTADAWQWFGTIAVAPSGRIDVVWLDTRDGPGIYDSSLYYAYSEDGGLTWSPNQRLSEAFDPHLGWPQQNKLGDYFDMVSEDHAAHVAWAGTFNGEQDVYYGRISHASDAPALATATRILFDSRPSPFSRSAILRYDLPRRTLVSLKVFDVAGREIATLADGLEGPGEVSRTFDAGGLPTGVYFARLGTGTCELTQRLMLLKQ